MTATFSVKLGLSGFAEAPIFMLSFWGVSGVAYLRANLSKNVL